MSLPWIHPQRTKEVLRAAGMSEQSELNAIELANIQAARRALDENPSIARDRLYRIIRPRIEDDE